MGHVALTREKKNAYRGLVAKCPEKKRLGRHTLKQEDNIKTDVD